MAQKTCQSMSQVASCVHMSVCGRTDCSWQRSLSNRTCWRYEGQDVRFLAEEKLSSQGGSPHFYLTKPLLWHLMKHSPSVCACAVRSAQTVKWARRWRLVFFVLFFFWCGAGFNMLIWICEHHQNYRKHSTSLKSCLSNQLSLPSFFSKISIISVA